MKEIFFVKLLDSTFDMTAKLPILQLPAQPLGVAVFEHVCLQIDTVAGTAKIFQGEPLWCLKNYIQCYQNNRVRIAWSKILLTDVVYTLCMISYHIADTELKENFTYLCK